MGGTLAALTGCLGNRRQSDGPPPTGTRTRTATPTRTDEPTADVTVESLHLQYGVVTPSSPDSIGISHADTPYLVASVRVDGPLSWEAFGLRMADVRYAPTRLDRLYRTTWGEDHWYERGRSDGLVLFEAPSTATDDLQLIWPGGERPVDDGIVARLDGETPRLSASFDVPETHDGRTAPDITIDVTNEGSTAGRFLGALNRVGPVVAYTPVTRLSRLVPAGESETISVADSWGGSPAEERLGDGEPDVTYRLDYPGGEDAAAIRLRDPS
ncbi:hypothetical protein ATH50_1027 [Haloplanus aerogenes]|nr:hypothetical protein ATH50_1027 [Haloplanus aerogenes]